MRPSQQTEHAKALTFSQARPILGFDDGQAPAELDRQPGADPAVESLRQFVQPANSEPEPKVVEPVEIQRSAYSSRYRSPSADQKVSGAGKCDDCRCRGTLQHGPFRRDATPGYSTGDCCRPPSPPAAVAACRNNDEKHTANHDLISVRQKMKFEGKVESNACNAKEKGDAGDSSSRRQSRGSTRNEDPCNDKRSSVTPRNKVHYDHPSSGDGSSEDSSDADKDRRRKDSGRRRDRHRRRRSRSHSSGTGDSTSRSRHRSAVGHRRWLKPEKFDGRSSFETFMCMFENCATYNKWRQKDKVTHLRWALTGPAAQLLWDTDDASYEELADKLRRRFGGKDMEERFQNDLRCRRRGKTESIRELAQDVRRLMALAYPGEKSSLADHIARDAFLSALDDSEFELKIREREPPDLDTAVKLAQRFRSVAWNCGRYFPCAS